MSHWQLPLDRPHRLAQRAGSYVFVGGAGDFDTHGKIRHAGDLEGQIAGTLENIATALDTEGLSLDDVIRLKAFYKGDGGQDEWEVFAHLQRPFTMPPAPGITANPVPLQPWPGQLVQIQAIAQKGWRAHPHVRFVTDEVPGTYRKLFKQPAVTAGLRAGEMFTVPARTAAAAVQPMPEDRIDQTMAVMQRMGRILGELGCGFQDAIKMEGYYFGTTMEQWRPLAEARASHFREPGPVATVVPCHALNPQGAHTKVEVLGLRDHWNGFDKYVPREDRWPKRVWDWSIPLPYRQGIRMRDMIWTGGQVPFEPDENKGRPIFASELIPQTQFTMVLIEEILRAFGAVMSDLALLVCYFTSDGSDKTTRAMADILTATSGGVLPPITLVPQPMMHSAEMTVEIWGVARG
ncbi:MAG: RidA family protein [Hyphomicrobiaceae bacterium]